MKTERSQDQCHRATACMILTVQGPRMMAEAERSCGACKLRYGQWSLKVGNTLNNVACIIQIVFVSYMWESVGVSLSEKCTSLNAPKVSHNFLCAIPVMDVNVHNRYFKCPSLPTAL